MQARLPDVDQGAGFVGEESAFDHLAEDDDVVPALDLASRFDHEIAHRIGENWACPFVGMVERDSLECRFVWLEASTKVADQGFFASGDQVESELA